MKPGRFFIFVISLWPAIIVCEKVENKFWEIQFGSLDNLIIKILESLRPFLTNLSLEKENFETGVQEFGNFKGILEEVTVRGLENFRVKHLNTSLLDIHNLTIVVESFTVNGFYQINGTLAFPLGRNDIHFFGDGEFRAKFEDCFFSVKLIIRFENGRKTVRNLDIVIGLQRMNVYLENLLGGGDLEKVFNKLLNEVGLTVFNYYEEPILNSVKPYIVEMINKVLNNEARRDLQFFAN